MQVIKFAHAFRQCTLNKYFYFGIRAYKIGIGHKQSLIASPQWAEDTIEVILIRNIMQIPTGTMQIPGFSDITIRR